MSCGSIFVSIILRALHSSTPTTCGAGIRIDGLRLRVAWGRNTLLDGSHSLCQSYRKRVSIKNFLSMKFTARMLYYY